MWREARPFSVGTARNSAPQQGQGSACQGRPAVVNVTRPTSRPASAGPTPRTRWSPSSDPNGPWLRRSSTIRRASDGPIPGRASISAAVADSTLTMIVGEAAYAARFGSLPSKGRSVRGLSETKRSAGSAPNGVSSDRTAPTGVEGDLSGVGALPFLVVRLARGPDARFPASRTRVICESSEATAAPSGGVLWLADAARTPNPAATTRRRTSEARDDEEDMGRTSHPSPPPPSSIHCDSHHFIAAERRERWVSVVGRDGGSSTVDYRCSSAQATSPTILSDEDDTLSIVSSGVWCHG